MNTWDMIHAERAGFADTLDGLSDSDWDRQSLSAQWTVRDVVAHMVATATSTPPKFIAAMAKSGFRFSKMVSNSIQQLENANSDKELAAMYRAHINSTNGPPGPAASWLGETIVHGEDVTRALGTYGNHNVDYVVAAANFYKKSNMLIGAKRRISGVQLIATDADWRHGSGPTVEGPAIALVLAMTGRRVALDDLTGEGVEVLRRSS